MGPFGYHLPMKSYFEKRISLTNGSGTLFRGFLLLSLSSWGLLACQSATSPGGDELELISIEDSALILPSVDAKALSTEPLETMNSVIKVLDHCLTFHSDEGVAKEQVKDYQRACFSEFDTVLMKSWAFVGATFQLDRFYADAARAHDAIRLALWRNEQPRPSEKLMTESWAQAQSSLARTKERAEEIIQDGEIETAIETRFVGDSETTHSRFLTSSEAELGLLFDQSTRSIFKQGSNPNNVRVKIMEYHLAASKRRLIARTLYILESIKAGELPESYEPLWRNYAARSLNLIRGIKTSLDAQTKKSDKNLSLAKKNKARVGEQYLKWLSGHNALKNQ